MFDILYGGLTIGSVVFVFWCIWSLCKGEIPFSQKAKDAKTAKTVLGAARTFILSYEDLPAYSGDTPQAGALAKLRAAWTAKDVPACQKLLEELDPPKPFAAGREWLDILVVAVSVAMAFRAYFYEPFHIPTGSMQPTLYGNHSEALDPAKATFWDKTPGLRWYKWFLTGKMYECFTAPFNGTLRFQQTNTGHYDMRVVNGAQGVMSASMLVPTDVLHPTETGDGPYRGTVMMLPNGFKPGSPVQKGDVLWSGYVRSGDFLFVNRWLWNFRRPSRGDVMIFSTTGIPGLQQGTHYIKRMTGVPGETLEMVQTGGSEEKGDATYELRVNGKKPMEPLRIAQIQNREKWHEKAYPYAGYRPSGRPDYEIPGKTLVRVGDKVTLGADEFYACGDNSPSSYDSRFWGPVPAQNLVGIAGGVFWPFLSHRWGPIR